MLLEGLTLSSGLISSITILEFDCGVFSCLAVIITNHYISQVKQSKFTELKAVIA